MFNCPFCYSCQDVTVALGAFTCFALSLILKSKIHAKNDFADGFFKYNFFTRYFDL